MKKVIFIIWLCAGICGLAAGNEAEEIYQSAKPLMATEAPDASKLLGFALMREAADKGNTKAQSIVGFHFANGDIVGKDISNGIKYLKNAAASGDFFASRNLRVLSEPNAVESSENRTAAREALIAAADHGSAAAAAQMGEIYFFGGDGLHPDYQLAEKYLLIAADELDLQACNTLGVIYEKGLAGEVDKKKALAYYEKAANSGHAKAQASLGFAYAGGGGVDHDLIKAYKWFTLSSLQGEVTGKNALADFVRGLSDEQVTEGNRLVVEFLKKQGKEVPEHLLQKKVQTNSQTKNGAE